MRGGSSGSLNEEGQIVLRCRTKEDRARSFHTRTQEASSPMGTLPCTSGFPTGSTGLAVLLPAPATRLERWMSKARPPKVAWVDWSWSLTVCGGVFLGLDAVTGEVAMVGDVFGAPIATRLPVEERRGYLSLRCGVCGRGLARNALLVADVRGGGVRIGCTRCLPPPPGENAPTPAEVRASLEATSWAAGR